MTDYHPNPASILANLIHNGLATESPDSLPPEWRAGYQAARQVSDRSGLYDRRLAFQQAVAEEPARYIMEAEIEDASKGLSFIGQQRIYAAWETLDSPPPISEFVVEGLFDRSSLNLLVGAPGTKKTWTAIDLAVCVASGRPWLGHSTTPRSSGEKLVPSEPLRGDEGSEIENHQSKIINFSGSSTHGTPVLILDAEGGVRRMWDRLGRTLRGHDADPKVPLYFMPPSFINFTRGDREAEYISKVANSLGAKLIIIDALANVMGGADENNVLSVQPIFDTLRKLAKDTSAAVIVIHHANKQGLFRGSSFMSSSVDHMLLVESPPDDNLLSIRTFKARDLAPVLLTARAVFNTADSVGALEPVPSDPLQRRRGSRAPSPLPQAGEGWAHGSLVAAEADRSGQAPASPLR